MKAFPHIAKVHYLDGNSIVKEEITSGGMELEDYFAAKAMQTLLQTDPERWHTLYMDKYENMLEGVADVAYRMSKEMMKAREAK